MKPKNTILAGMSLGAFGLLSGCADVPGDTEVGSEVSKLDLEDGGVDSCEGTAVVADAVVSTQGVLNRVRVCADYTGDPETDRGATGIIQISAAPPEPSTPTLEGTVTCARSPTPGDVVISGVITTPGLRFGWGYIAALRDGLQEPLDFVKLPIPFPTGGIQDPLRCNRMLSPTAGEVIDGEVVVPLIAAYE